MSRAALLGQPQGAIHWECCTAEPHSRPEGGLQGHLMPLGSDSLNLSRYFHHAQTCSVRLCGIWTLLQAIRGCRYEAGSPQPFTHPGDHQGSCMHLYMPMLLADGVLQYH